MSRILRFCAILAAAFAVLLLQGATGSRPEAAGETAAGQAAQTVMLFAGELEGGREAWADVAQEEPLAFFRLLAAE